MQPNRPKNENCRNCPAWSKSAFADLGEEDLADLQKNKTMDVYPRGALFSRQGQAANEVYCLASGSAKVTLSSPATQKESIVRIAAQGDLLGYRCIFSEETFRATASALTETRACTIERSFVFGLIERRSNFSRELLTRMGKEISAAEYHHHSFCQKNVRERMAEALLILNQRCGVKIERGWKIDTQLTRTELSNWVGAAKETVIRCLTDFREELLIDNENESFILLDLPKLNEIAGLRS